MSPAAKGIPSRIGALVVVGQGLSRDVEGTEQTVGDAESKTEAAIAVVIRAISRAVEIRDRTETATRPFVGG